MGIGVEKVDNGRELDDLLTQHKMHKANFLPIKK
jgi:hypothetical protein